jgi:uroporphyrinogen decarboxylase
MTPWERIDAAIAGGRVDRVPWALWRHFPRVDLNPRRLAEATVRFCRTFEFDLVKITPAGGYMAEAWGARLEPKNDEEGVREYLSRPVHSPEDWRKIRPVESVLEREVRCVRWARRLAPRSVPILQTIFSPLTVAKNLSGDLWGVHLRRRPRDLAAGLERIAEVTRRFALRCLDAGCDGVFFATQLASHDALTESEYRRFGESFDRQVIEAVKGLVVLHAHGSNIMFDRLSRYPVDVLNWHDRRTPPSLREGLRRFRGACLGGLESRTLRGAGEAVGSTRGRRLILGAGCVIPVRTPSRMISAVRDSLLL